MCMINLEEEVRNGYTISAEMKKVWSVEMNLLKKLLEVCEKHNLKIWAEGGTLLGTVREQGFIPWDDDIDMAMPREDYDRLQDIAKDEFHSPFFFQSGYTDLFPNGMTRLRMDGTAAILPQSIYQNCHQGIFIDIFPIDVIPDDTKELNDFLQVRARKKQELKFFCVNHWSMSNLKYDWVILKTKLRIHRKGFHAAFRAYDLYIKQFSKSDNQTVSIISWFYDERYFRKKDWYRDTCYMPFETILIPVPIEFDKILKQQYGDYMVPVKAPTMHGLYGGFEALDATKSYKEYLPEIRKKKRKEVWITKINYLANLLHIKTVK